MQLLHFSSATQRISRLAHVARAKPRCSPAWSRTHQASLMLQHHAIGSSRSIGTLHTESHSPSSIVSALKEPYSLQGVHHVIIKEPDYYVDSEDDIRARPDPWDPPQILTALEELPHLKSVSIDVNQIMLHSATSDQEARYHYEDGVPEYVLDQLGLSCRSTGLCAWSVEGHPKVLIHHATSRKLFFESQQYKGNLEMWKYIVSQQKAKPEYKAFDYTAEFYSRDICGPDCGCKGPTVDLGLWGAGNYDCGSVSELSMRFVQDFRVNTRFFNRSPETWRPDLYAHFRKRDNAVTSVLTFKNFSD